MEALPNHLETDEVELIIQTHQDTAARVGSYTSSVDKVEADSRSIYVGNVDYCSTSSELEAHFYGCGPINRVTILNDKFTGHPKGFAYIEFADKEAAQTAMALDGSLFRGRQIKVCAKRTNRPGVGTMNRFLRGRGRGVTQVVVKYIYPNYRGRRPTRRFAPY